jgi:hypothetical protein
MVQNPPPEVGNMVEELNMLSSKIKPTQIQQETSPLPTVQKEAVQAPIPQPLSEPIPEQTPSSKLAKNKPSPVERISFDKAITRVLEQKMKQIDEEAAAKKRTVEDRFYDRLYSLIDSIATDTPPQQIIPASQPILPIATPLVSLPSKKKSFGRFSKILIAIAIILSLLVALFIAINLSGASLVSTQNIGSSAFIAVPGIGIYADAACTKNVTNVDWGRLYQGGVITKTAYIQNSGSVNQTLIMTTNTWTPATMAQYATFTWNNANYVLMPGQSVEATFTLAIASNAQGGRLSFNIKIDGVGV